MRRLDFEAINRAGLASLLALLRRWLPDGRLIGREYTARNPRRADKRPGSFRINVNNGKWADFATDDAGGDVVSLAARKEELPVAPSIKVSERLPDDSSSLD